MMLTDNAIETALAFGAVLLTSAAVAQPSQGPPTSVYTRLDLHRCVKQPQGEVVDDIVWRCLGYRNIPLFVLSSAGRIDVDAGAENGVFESPERSSRPPDRIEWRFKAGRPRSIIYKYRIVGGGDDPANLIAVETVSYPNVWAGCLIALIDARRRDATLVARTIADRNHSKFRCGHDEPQQLPRGASFK
jgi:hypothetical protein